MQCSPPSRGEAVSLWCRAPCAQACLTRWPLPLTRGAPCRCCAWCTTRLRRLWACAAATRRSRRARSTRARGLRRWAAAAAAPRSAMGRPVCAAFEARARKALPVLEEGGHARVNVAYGYAATRLAARAAQALPQRRAHPRVAGLSLSDEGGGGVTAPRGAASAARDERQKSSAAACGRGRARVMCAIHARIVAGRVCAVRRAQRGRDGRVARRGAQAPVRACGRAPRLGATLRRPRALYGAHHRRRGRRRAHALLFSVRPSPPTSAARACSKACATRAGRRCTGWSWRAWWRRVLTTRGARGQLVTAEHVRPYLVHRPPPPPARSSRAKTSAWMNSACLRVCRRAY